MPNLSAIDCGQCHASFAISNDDIAGLDRVHCPVCGQIVEVEDDDENEEDDEDDED